MGDKLIIKIDGDSKGFEKALSGVEKTGLSAFGGMEKAVKGVAIGAAAAATAVAGLATAAVKGYAEFEQLTGGIETLFKKSAPKVQEYAKNAYKTAGLTANEYLDTTMKFSARLIQGLGDDTDAAAEFANLAITDMADNVNKMGSSMEMVQDAYRGFAKGNFTMLDNLNLGYGGTREEMLRLVNESGTLEKKITDLDDVTFDQMISAIHKVQTNLGITGTTAAEAKHTISGSANAAKAAWKNLVTGLADENADIEILMKNFTDSVGIMFENLLPVIKTSLKNIGIIALDSLEKMTGINFRDKFAPLFEGLGNLEKSISNGTLKMAFDNLKGWFMGSSDEGYKFGVAMKYIFGEELGEQITGFFGGMQEPMQWIMDNEDAITGAITGMAIAFGTMAVVGTISQMLTGMINPLNLIILLGGLLGAGWNTNFLGMRDITDEMITDIIAFIDSLDTKIATIQKTLSDWYADPFGTRNNQISTGIKYTDPVVDAASGFMDSTSLLLGIDMNMVMPQVNVSTETVNTDMLQPTVETAVREFSPAGTWNNTMTLSEIKLNADSIDAAGVMDGITEALEDNQDAIDAGDKVPEALSKKWKDLGYELYGHSIIPDMITDISAIFVTWAETIGREAEAVTQAVLDKFTVLSTNLKGIFQTLAGDGISSEEEEGSGSILSGMTKIAEYSDGDFTTSLDALGSFMVETFIPNVDKTRDSLFIVGGGGNTLYNSLGAVQGVAESINAVFRIMIDIFKHSFKEAVDKVKIQAGELMAALDPIERKGRSIAEAFDRALDSILAVASALSKLPANTPGGTSSNAGLWPDANVGKYTAWGGWSSMNKLTMVGERGPELIGTSRMMNVWRNDEIRKQMEEAGAGMSNKKYYGGQQNINANTTNDNSTNVTLGNVYGDDYLDQRMEAKLMTMIRKGVFVGAG